MFRMVKTIIAALLLVISTLGHTQSTMGSGLDYADFSLDGGWQDESLTTISFGFDYVEGKYGEPETSTTYSLPLIVKHERGPLTLKLNIPWVRASGSRAAGGDLGSVTKQVESGLGEIVLSGAYNVYLNSNAAFGIDLGGKIKFAGPDHSKTLITTGENDYSLQGDAYKSFSDLTLFGTVGRTKKGDPDYVDFRDPWFVGLGLSYKLSSSIAFGGAYDYRQKVTRRGDPISEASAFLTYKFTKQIRLQTYVVGGFSDASPDFGIGSLVSVAF